MFEMWPFSALMGWGGGWRGGSLGRCVCNGGALESCMDVGVVLGGATLL